MESVEGIDFTHSSREAWKSFNCLTGRSARPRQCPVTANSIAHQLLANWRNAGASKTHSLNVKRQCSALWNSPGMTDISHHLSHRRYWPMPSNCSSARKLKDRITSHQSSLNTSVAVACRGCVSSIPVASIVSPSRRSGERQLSQLSQNRTSQWTIPGATDQFPFSVFRTSCLNTSCFDSSLLSTPICRPDKVSFEGTALLPNRLSNWLAILKRAMKEDVRRVSSLWILLRPMTLSGIRAWHWSYSRLSLIDTWSASLSK